MAEKTPVEIPVRVTGAEKAQADLKSTGAAVQQLGAAGGQAAAGAAAQAQAGAEATRQVNEEGRAHDESTAKINLNRHSRMLLLEGIRAINPEMSEAAQLLFHVAMGAEHITTALVGLAAGGAAIGAIVAAVKTWREEEERLVRLMERAEEFRKEQRDRGLELRAKVFEAGTEAGISLGVAGQDEAIRRVTRMQERGVDQKTAVEAEVIRQRFSLTSDQGETVLRALAAGVKPEFTGKVDEDTKKLAELLTVGGEDRAGVALRNLIAAKGEQARRSIQPDEGAKIDEGAFIDTELKALRDLHPDLNDKELVYISRAARERRFGLEMADVAGFGWWEDLKSNARLTGSASDALLAMRPEGADHSLGLLSRIAEAVESFARQRAVEAAPNTVIYANSLYERTQPERVRPAPSSAAEHWGLPPGSE